MSPRCGSRYGNRRFPNSPGSAYATRSTSRWSPIRREPSIDPVGITYACTSVVVPKKTSSKVIVHSAASPRGPGRPPIVKTFRRCSMKFILTVQRNSVGKFSLNRRHLNRRQLDMGRPYALSRFTTMWNQNYTPIAGSLGLSSIAAAIPIFVLLFLLGVKRKPAWIAALSGLAAAALVATFAYGMPADKLFSAVIYGLANGLFPIGWVVFTAILLYRITVEMGKFETLKDSVGNLSEDRRLQALLIAFAFGAFIEGAAGFGTPVAVAAAMLTGLGFSPFYA